MRNGGRTHVTLRKLYRSKAAVQGFREVREGKPFNPDAFRGGRDQQRYERGRLLASIYDGPLKFGQTVSGDAISAAEAACRLKWIV